MQDPDQRAHVARVSRPDATGRATLFYAVLSDTRQAALGAVRAAAQPDDYVESPRGAPPETTEELGLIPGVAKPM
jgi:hypothetical protein